MTQSWASHIWPIGKATFAHDFCCALRRCAPRWWPTVAWRNWPWLATTGETLGYRQSVGQFRRLDETGWSQFKKVMSPDLTPKYGPAGQILCAVGNAPMGFTRFTKFPKRASTLPTLDLEPCAGPAAGNTVLEGQSFGHTRHQRLLQSTGRIQSFKPWPSSDNVSPWHFVRPTGKEPPQATAAT